MKSIKSRLPALALAATLCALASPSPARADASCLKQVFGLYCLGGAAPAGAPADGEHAADEHTQLLLRDGRIQAVSRQLQPADWLRFNELKVRLVRLYSTAEDVSDFPRYATSRSSKLNAIRAGRGYAAARWQQPGWAVQLEWRTLDHLLLRYERLAPTPTSATDTLEGL